MRCVLLDTNILLFESRLLRSPLGASLAHHLAMAEQKLLLPEVVEREVLANAVADAASKHRKLQDDCEALTFLTGLTYKVEGPGEHDHAAAFSARLAELSPIIHRVPFTFEHASRALTSVIDKTPPCHGAQQFKDAAIWAAAVEVSKKNDVCLVTRDKAFYEGGRYDAGLVQSLQDESNSLRCKISLVSSIGEFLSAASARPPAPLPRGKLVQLLEDPVAKEIYYLGPDYFLTLSSPDWKELTAFVSDKPGAFAYNFRVRFTARSDDDVDPDDVFDGFIEVAGECLVEMDSQRPIDELVLLEVATFDTAGVQLMRQRLDGEWRDESNARSRQRHKLR